MSVSSEQVRDYTVAFTFDASFNESVQELRATILKEVEIDDSYSPTCLPHVTLIQGSYSKDGSQKASELIEDIISGATIEDIQLENELFLYKGSRNLFWNCSVTRSLYDLHMNMAERLNEVREGRATGSSTKLLQDPNLDESCREVIGKYGYAGTRELFLPHITLVKLAELKEYDKLSKLYSPQNVLVKPDKVIVAEIGFFGDIKEIVSSKDL